MSTLRNVIVETSQPNPLALSSHLSSLNEQICALKIGDKIGYFEWLGMQVEDCSSNLLAAMLELQYREGHIPLGTSCKNNGNANRSDSLGDASNGKRKNHTLQYSEKDFLNEWLGIANTLVSFSVVHVRGQDN